MILFESDYIEGCHEKVLERLCETNMEQLSGYGLDKYCESAKEKIKEACECKEAEVFFLNGGTQTNQLIIDEMLDSYQGVVGCSSAHINGHEAGAIERSGHKVMTVPEHDGKINPDELRFFLLEFWNNSSHNHMVFPGMVYISHPTEYGTLYTADELQQISDICRKYEIPLFMDGARLGYGLCSNNTDVTLPLITRLCDVFYIGGTKVGALCGEAVVFTHNNAPAHFFTRIKQHGALLAKGRLLGVQFDALFTDNLYFEISKHAIDMADKLKEVFKRNGYNFYIDSPTNQQFIILSNEQAAKISSTIKFSIWERIDENYLVARFVTSWATRSENIETLAQTIET